MMTIAEFAERTGLAPSTLRFYESKKILLPSMRLENGFRCYAEDQIAHAKLVNSLRQSGIGLGDIRRFLEAEDDFRARLLDNWRREAEARMLFVQIANHYLNGFRHDGGSLHLTKWDEPVTMLWQPFTLNKPLSTYTGALRQAMGELRTCNLKPAGSSVVRVIESLEHTIRIEVGIPVASSANRLTAALKLVVAARPYWVIRKKAEFFETHNRLKEQGFDTTDIAGNPKFLVLFHTYDPFGNQINIWSYEDC